MTVEETITDPLLTPILTTARTTLQQALTIIDFLSTHASSPTTRAHQLTVARHQKLLQAHLSKLRVQTRRTAYGARNTKALTAEAKTEVDRLLLQLQNLYYEQRHLMGEIAACEGYDHAYEKLPLIEVDEYLDLFPDQAELTEEEMMQRRIEYEAAERRRMEVERQELVEVKERLVAENAKKKEELKKMDEKLEAWVEGLKPLEEELAKDL